MTHGDSVFSPRLSRRRLAARLFSVVSGMVMLGGLLILLVLVIDIVQTGWSFLSVGFLTRFPSFVRPESSGVKSAILGTAWLIGLTVLIAVPLGIGAAVYLHEYAPRNRWTRWIEVNIANLAGVPSVVYGLLGLALFVRGMSLGRCILAGALTMSLVILPVVILSSREALVAVPNSIRQAAFALGATRWQAIRSHVLPMALPGILTGVILSISRAMGEAAPLIMVGAAAFIRHVPSGPRDSFTALPIQIYSWSEQSLPVFQELAAAAIVVLLCMLLPINAIAVAVRAHRQEKKQ